MKLQSQVHAMLSPDILPDLSAYTNFKGTSTYSNKWVAWWSSNDHIANAEQLATDSFRNQLSLETFNKLQYPFHSHILYSSKQTDKRPQTWHSTTLTCDAFCIGGNVWPTVPPSCITQCESIALSKTFSHPRFGEFSFTYTPGLFGRLPKSSELQMIFGVQMLKWCGPEVEIKRKKIRGRRELARWSWV